MLFRLAYFVLGNKLQNTDKSVVFFFAQDGFVVFVKFKKILGENSKVYL